MHCVHILQLLKAFIIINVTTLIIKGCLYNDWFVTCKAMQDIRTQITPIYCNSICFQVKSFLRRESGALLLIPCSLGPSESFLCDKIELGELLQIIGLNEGTMLPEMLHIYKKTKNLSLFSSEWKRNSKLRSACNQTSRKGLKSPGSFPPSPSIIAFPVFSWISRFSQANSFQPFNISPMSEGRIALHGVAMETPAGYGMEMGEEQGEKRKRWDQKAKAQEPHRVSFLCKAACSSEPTFFWIYLHSSELCVRTGEFGTPPRRR